jgi:hypothetical protein
MRGAQVPVAYYDPSQVHIPIHRDAQIQAELSGDVGAWQRIEKHIQEHEQNDAQNAQQVAQIQATAPAADGPEPASATASGAARPANLKEHRMLSKHGGAERQQRPRKGRPRLMASSPASPPRRTSRKRAR